ncbi:hypothetical protein, partial [Pontibacter flavimaris]|uniref:hypothetical protein n=1 Tax=Pontibacter flavimaris TaxID=1797110 RepID=UPI00198065A7
GAKVGNLFSIPNYLAVFFFSLFPLPCRRRRFLSKRVAKVRKLSKIPSNFFTLFFFSPAGLKKLLLEAVTKVRKILLIPASFPPLFFRAFLEGCRRC